MKYTEAFLKFPIRIYDRFDYIKSVQEELKEYNDSPREGGWIEGIQAVDYTDIVEYSDYYDSIKGVEGVSEEGYTETLVVTNTNSYICTLPLAKFEELLNKHHIKLSGNLKENSN